MAFKKCVFLLMSTVLFSLYLISSTKYVFRESACVESLEFVEAKVMHRNSSDIDPTRFKQTIQALLISSRQSQFKTFLHRNRGSLPSENISIAWFPASDGRHQTILDEYAQLTGFPPLNASLSYDSTPYRSPHHTGCFMSHWNLLRLAKAGWEALHTTPNALFVFEYDALCATSMFDAVATTLQSLPPDWDMLYVGGKPFSYHNPDMLSQDVKQKWSLRNFTDEEFKDTACQGGFGDSTTGPFAPDGSRNLSLDQPYWQTKYITNTQSYIVNPKRIDRILDVLEHPPRGQEPIDIMLAEAARSGTLKILMTTMEYCVQENIHNDIQGDQPRIWQGYYNVHGLQNYRWNNIFFPQCPSKP